MMKIYAAGEKCSRMLRGELHSHPRAGLLAGFRVVEGRWVAKCSLVLSFALHRNLTPSGMRNNTIVLFVLRCLVFVLITKIIPTCKNLDKSKRK